MTWGGKHTYMYNLATEVKSMGHRIHFISQKGGLFAQRMMKEGFTVTTVDFDQTHSPIACDRLDAKHKFLVATGHRDLEAIVRWDIINEATDFLVFIRHSGFDIPDTPAAHKAIRRCNLIFATSFQQLSTQFCNKPLTSRICSVKVLPSGVDIKKLHPKPYQEKCDLKNKLGIDSQTTVFGYAGRMSWEKQISDLLRAWDVALSSSKNDAKLVLLGDGDKKDIENLIEDRKLENSVLVLDHRDNVSGVIQTFDWSVLNSQAEETGPLFLKESMALGIPVIARDTGGISEFVDEHVGILLPRESNFEIGIRRALEVSEVDRNNLGMQAAKVIQSSHTALNMALAFVQFNEETCLLGRQAQLWCKDARFSSSLRFREERQGGFIFSPKTSAIYELNDKEYACVKSAFEQGSFDPIFESGEIDHFNIVKDLYIGGFIMGSASEEV